MALHPMANITVQNMMIQNSNLSNMNVFDGNPAYSFILDNLLVNNTYFTYNMF